MMQVDGRLDPNTELLARSLSILHRAHGVSTRKGPATTHRLPSTPEAERTGVPGDDGVARQRALISHPSDDEQRGNDLSVTMIRRQFLEIEIGRGGKTART
jgi:hypothetical protein